MLQGALGRGSSCAVRQSGSGVGTPALSHATQHSRRAGSHPCGAVSDKAADKARLLELASVLGLSADEVEPVASRVPGLLRKAPSAIKDKVAYVASKAEMPLPQTAAILLARVPEALLRSPATLLAKLRAIEEVLLEDESAAPASETTQAQGETSNGLTGADPSDTSSQGTGLARALLLLAKYPDLATLDLSKLGGLGGATLRELRELER